MGWDWGIVSTAFPLMLRGVVVTAEATVLGCGLAFVLGLILTLPRFSRIPALALVTWAFVEFVRDTPLLVQLYFVFFVFPSTFGIRLGPLAAGVITLGVHYAASASDTYRAGIQAVPRGQWEAATALSLPRHRMWISVVLPQAVRRSLPSLGNYLISMFKDTPVLLTVGVLEMADQAKQVGSVTYSYLEPFTIAGILFLLLSYPSSILVRRLERHVGTRLRRPAVRRPAARIVAAGPMTAASDAGICGSSRPKTTRTGALAPVRPWASSKAMSCRARRHARSTGTCPSKWLRSAATRVLIV